MRRIRGGDDGAVLVLALLFITAIALLTTSVLARTTAASSTTTVERQFLTKRYAAEAGLDYALQQIRQRPNLCPSSASVNGDLLNPDDLLGDELPVNNPEQPLRVECQVTSNSDIGFGGYGLITRDSSTNGVLVTGAANERLKINGPVFLSDVDNPLRFDITDGDLLLRTTGTCPNPVTLKVSFTGPHNLQCVTYAAPDPVPTLPTIPAASFPTRSAAPEKKFTKNDCSMWRPGRYTSINLDRNNYFTSGVYYFHNVDLSIVKGSLTGGMPDDAEGESKVTAASCRKDDGTPVTDADIAGAGGNGTGVKIILGGSSRIVADNPKGIVELFARQAPSESQAALEGTQRVSVMTVKATTTSGGVTYTKSTHGFTSVVLGVANPSSGGGGSTIEMVMHGGVYAGDGLVQVRNQKNATEFRSGLVAGRLEISTSANVDGFNIGIRTTPQPRDVLVTSVAGDTGERVVTAAARARMDNQTGALEVLSRNVDVGD